MRDSPRGRLILPFLILLGMTSCMDRSPTVPEDAQITLQASLSPGDCALNKDITSNARGFFLMPERQTAQKLAGDLEKACKAADAASRTGLAIQLLEMMEAALDAGRVDKVAVGSNLANGLLACTQGFCNQSAWPGIDFAPSFGTAGTFAIRHGTSVKSVVARDWVKFTDTRPPPLHNMTFENLALWGIDVDKPWKDVANTDPVVIYGSKTSTLNTNDPGIGGIQNDYKRWPVVGNFGENLHVWVCFAQTAALPHGHGDPEPKGRMQRETILLSEYNPTCPPAPTTQAASVLAPILNLARSVLPRNLFAFVLRTDTRTPHVGGSALDFSTFAPVAANTEGYLEWVVPPASVVTVGQPLAPGGVKVKAFSGSGTPMELVEITLTVQNNSGTPAGAFVSDNVAFTTEIDGVASFPTAAVNKAGGYTICATGKLGGFTFEPRCSDMFHARN